MVWVKKMSILRLKKEKPGLSFKLEVEICKFLLVVVDSFVFLQKSVTKFLKVHYFRVIFDLLFCTFKSWFGLVYDFFLV